MTRKKNDDEAFREWVRRQSSCISGRFSEYVNGEGRCISAHVRRAATSGMAFKAPLSCVPLTNAEHQTQHQGGELACLAKHLSPTRFDLYFGGMTHEEKVGASKFWFDEQAAKYREEWRRLQE